MEVGVMQVPILPGALHGGRKNDWFWYADQALNNGHNEQAVAKVGEEGREVEDQVSLLLLFGTWGGCRELFVLGVWMFANDGPYYLFEK